MKIIRILLVAMTLGLAAPAGGPARAESGRETVLRQYLDRLTRFGFSGQVLIAEHGNIVFQQSCGLADAASGTAVTPRTRFPIASLTKSFTALAILSLEHDGRLALGDTLGKFFPEVPRDKASITVEQLLTHTSGLRRDVVSDSLGRDRAVRRILEAPLRPERGFAYSNSGYELLAAIVEGVAGEPYDRCVARRVFTPAGMRESGFLDEKLPAGTPLAHGHRDGAPNARAWDPAPGWKGTGSGSIYSTVEDLARWHRALLDGRIVPEPDRRRVMTPRVETGEGTSYGYGWFVAWPGTDSTLVFHGGDSEGFHSELRWYAHEDQLIVILTNQDVFDIDGGAVAKRIVARGLRRILLGRPVDDLPEATSLAASDRESLVGGYALDPVDRVDLVAIGSGLRIRATGSAAAAALLPASDTLAATQQSCDVRALAIIDAVAFRDTSKLDHGLDRGEYAFAGPFLADEIANDRRDHGDLERVEILGSAPLPWDASAWRTYALLHFSDRTVVDIYLGRNGRALNDCTSGAGFRHLIDLPVARVASGDLVAFDILRRRSIPLALERDAQGGVRALMIGGPEGPRAVRSR